MPSSFLQSLRGNYVVINSSFIAGLWKKNLKHRSTMTRVLKFNVKTEQFTAWPNLNQGRYHHSCTRLNDKIMVVGGFEGGMGEGMSLTSTEIIPLSTR